LLSSDNLTLTVSGFFNHRNLSPNISKVSFGNAQWNIKSRSWVERSSLVVGQITTDNQNILAGAILGAQTYRADLVVSDNLNSSRSIFNNSVLISAGVTWLNNKTGESNTIIAQVTVLNQTMVSVCNNVTGLWSTIDLFQGHVYSLATFGNWLYVGGQFSPTKQGNQSASLAIYDLSNNNTNIRIHGVSGQNKKLLHYTSDSFFETDVNNNPGIVNIIKPHPDGKKVLIGGKFSRVGMLECEAVCAIDPFTLQWDPVALGLTGTAYDIIVSISDNSKTITVVGDLSVQNQPATAIASVSDSADTWSPVLNSNQLSGIPTTVVSSIDNEIIVAGAR
jgi:hypothetical protein